MLYSMFSQYCLGNIEHADSIKPDHGDGLKVANIVLLTSSD